jgi:SAM-dependent methyltransferase
MRRIGRLGLAFGINGLELVRALRGLPAFVRDGLRYGRRRTAGDLPLRLKYLYPILGDRYEQAGTARGHYFHQDLWAAKRIYRAQPSHHVDVGSRVDGFVAHLLVFRDVTVVDVRRLSGNVPGLTFEQGSITALPLPDDSVPSVSCLHVLEHIGLGRYGDPVDPDGWRRGLAELQRVLAPGGRLYLGVPIGTERLHFNAHRVFRPATIIAAASRLTLATFSYVDDAGDLHENVEVERFPGAEYGCGLFEFRK